MIDHKHINRIICIVMAMALTAVSLMVVGNQFIPTAAQSNTPLYATQVFGSDIMNIEIIANEDDWQTMLDNATAEEYIMVDVIVNGTKFQNVGIRPKGNSSLTQVASSDSNRYSFRLQFDEYIKGQTCFGLESFVLNNMLSDNSYMKEYISYDLMKTIGVNTPYYTFADIDVNGEDWGFYLAIELYNESYEQRMYSDTSGMLYNVKSMEMNNNQENTTTNNPISRGEGNTGNTNRPNGFTNNTPQTGANPPDNVPSQPDETQENDAKQAERTGNPNISDNNASDRTGVVAGIGGKGGMGGGNTGGSLAYTDDSSSSYSAIFSNVVGKGTESDYQRVIEALKSLSLGQDLEVYFDVDQILRYLAAHTIVVNLDSYSSNMAQNYFLYEKDGKVTVLPWDYNMSWGGFQSQSASAVINFPIDTPVSGVTMADRPLLEKLFAVPEYVELYHRYLQELLNEYFVDGKLAAKINKLNALIEEYVKADASSFTTYEDYQVAVQDLITLGNLRAESVQGQLDGSVPSTTQAQTANPELLISAGNLSLQGLGSMGGNGRNGQISSSTTDPNGQLWNNLPRMGGSIDSTLMSQAMQIIRDADANGESTETFTEEVKEQLKQLGLSEEEINELKEMIALMPVDGMNVAPNMPNTNSNNQSNSSPFPNANNQSQQPPTRGGMAGDMVSNLGASSVMNTSVRGIIAIVTLLIVAVVANIALSKMRRSY